ncbi:MAG TPA: hypothetical protein PKB02_10645 [Anaerohalosphaeraceae bacterium]|nr:hypothetical protein [Anaerohalosphaeraceae bacterium]
MTEKEFRDQWMRQDNEGRIMFCYDHLEDLLDSNGLLEEFFYEAMTRAHFLKNHIEHIRYIVPYIDRITIRKYAQKESKNKMPDQEEFTLYRGLVACKSNIDFINENVRYNLWSSCGCSWTDSLEIAAWFTYCALNRFLVAPDFNSEFWPVILKAVFPNELILFFSNDRDEREYFVFENEDFLELEPKGLKILPLTHEEIKSLSKRRP